MGSFFMILIFIFKYSTFIFIIFMKSLTKHIQEKLIVNKNYSCKDSISKILDDLKERKSVIMYSGWGFMAEDKGIENIYENIYDEIKNLVVTESIKQMPKGTEQSKIRNMLKKGDAIVSFNKSVNKDPVISFIGKWNGFSTDPYLEINIILYTYSIRISAFLQDRLLGHCPHTSNEHHVIPKKILLELFQYVYDNDMADNMGQRQYHTFKEIYNGLDSHLK